MNNDALDGQGTGRRPARLLVIGLAVLFLAAIAYFRLYTSWCWFASLGYSSVYWKMNLARLACGLVFGGGFLVTVAFNLYVARRLGARTGEFTVQMSPDDSPVSLDAGVTRALLSIMVALLTIVFTLFALVRWPLLLRFLYRQPFNLADPIFGRDIGFYVFSLPFQLYIRNWHLGTLIIATLLTIWFYFHSEMITPPHEMGFWGTLKNLHFAPRVKAHLSVLAGLLFLNIAWGYQLKMFGLLYSRWGVAYGASYADVNARLIACWVLMLAAVGYAVLVIASVRQRDLKWPFRGLTAMAALWFVFFALIPLAITQLIVKPNEISKEKEFIEHNIRFTRQAYGLDKIVRKPFPAELKLTGEAIARNELTIDNIRLWDAPPLKQTYRQRQELRTYYEFENVDVDRYTIDGKYRQVMISAREMSSAQLPSDTWVNKHLKFTHGYGVVMNPVNQITGEGLPFAFIEDIPPVSTVDLKIERPEIYYGELTRDYAIVNTREEEFDYPHGDTNRYATYGGGGGVRMGSFMRRLAFACRFMAPNILFTRYITAESRIMLRRQISQRAQAVAPFLKYDKDPYIVISEGKLYWIQDAYTATTMYPYSTPYTGEKKRHDMPAILNYMRNSVKVVIDAYEGTTTFYLLDRGDPIARTYAAMFPALFTPFDEMPDDLKKHIRYPADMFGIQASMYNAYHMDTSNVFYNREDLWTSPTENYGGREQEMMPYYMIMKFPGQEKEEFLLMLPATPSNKRNMIALLVARSDGDGYGELFVSTLPKEKLVYGPMQIEARIDQDTDISKELTLWGQVGSSVMRGHLLVVPIEESLLYVEPVYLQATAGELPELKRVIVAYGEKIAMAGDLQAALAMIFSDIPEAPAVTVQPGGAVPSESVSRLTATALKHYRNAQKYLKAGNWTKYGEEIDAVEKTLLKLQKVSRGQSR